MLGFSVSLSGIQVGLRKLGVSANNVANATTPGFKASRADAVQISPGGAKVGSIRVNYSQGPIELQDGGFSLAVEGDGFFEVSTPRGNQYTRAGVFQVDSQGNVVTSEGFALQPAFQVPPDAVGVKVSPEGVISAVQPDGEVVDLGQVKLVRFPNSGGLEQQGDNLLSAGASSGQGGEGVPGEGGFGNLIFGGLESSNVDLTTEIVSQIVSSASVRANLASLRAQNETLGTIIDLQS